MHHASDSSYIDLKSDPNGLSGNFHADVPHISVQLAEWAMSKNVSLFTSGNLMDVNSKTIP